MTQVNTDNIPISACCNASTRVIGHTTKHYFCEACEQPCDLKVEVNTVTNDDELRKQILKELAFLQGAKVSDIHPDSLVSQSADDIMQLITADRAKAVLDGQIKKLQSIADFDSTVQVFKVTLDELDGKEPVYDRDFNYIGEVITELQNQRKAML